MQTHAPQQHITIHNNALKHSYSFHELDSCLIPHFITFYVILLSLNLLFVYILLGLCFDCDGRCCRRGEVWQLHPPHCRCSSQCRHWPGKVYSFSCLNQSLILLLLIVIPFELGISVSFYVRKWKHRYPCCALLFVSPRLCPSLW